MALYDFAAAGKSWEMKRISSSRFIIGGAILSFAAMTTAANAQVAGGTAAAEARAIQFNRDVRPILSEHCFACHGPDNSHRKADLRLDVRDHAGVPVDAVTRKLIIPHDPESSAVMQRVMTTDPEMIMPPPDARKALNA